MTVSRSKLRWLRWAAICAACFILDGCCTKPLIMPDEGFRAKISARDVPLRMMRGEKRQVEVRVRNASQIDWITSGVDRSDIWAGSDEDRYRIDLGNHWLDEKGNEIVHDDGRAELADIVRSGETIRVLLQVNAPQTAGEQMLEIDLLQENVTWFSAKGSETARYSIRIE